MARSPSIQRRFDDTIGDGQKIETIDRDTDRDNFLSADQAVQYGLVDKVLAGRTETAK